MADVTSRLRLLLAVLPLLSLTATSCTRPRHIPAQVVYEYRRSFSPGQLRPGWTLLSVGPNVEHPTTILHRVEVPAALAGELVMMSRSDRSRLVAEIACPPASHPIWSKLTRGQDVVIELYTDKGAFETVPCRANIS